MEDAGGADELFRVLTGDNFEPRRAFIRKQALRMCPPSKCDRDLWLSQHLSRV